MELTQLFKELVSIDSPSKQESAVAQYLKHWAEEYGFVCTGDTYGNIIVRTNATEPAKVFFSAHMDTVEPGRGIVCLEKDGFLVSDGKTILGADNKASLSGILHAVSNYDKNALPSIELVFTTEEETAMNAQFITKETITAPFGFIFDAPFAFGGIILGSPFMEDFYCTVTGTAAHASIPHEAKSVLPVIEKVLSSISCGYIDGDSKNGTVNIGIISLGSGVNTVPGNLEIKGEVRSFDKTIFENKKKEIATIFENLKSEYPEYVFECGFRNYAPGYLHEASSELVNRAQKALANIGRNSSLTTPQSVSDANHFNGIGVPTLVVSEGTQYAHTVTERISVVDLQDISRLVTQLINNL